MSLPDNTQRSLGRMEGKMDALLVSIAQLGTGLQAESAERKEALAQLDGRIRVLEDVRAEGKGVTRTRGAFLAGAGAIVGSFSAVIAKHLGLS